VHILGYSVDPSVDSRELGSKQHCLLFKTVLDLFNILISDVLIDGGHFRRCRDTVRLDVSCCFLH